MMMMSYFVEIDDLFKDEKELEKWKNQHNNISYIQHIKYNDQFLAIFANWYLNRNEAFSHYVQSKIDEEVKRSIEDTNDTDYYKKTNLNTYTNNYNSSDINIYGNYFGNFYQNKGAYTSNYSNVYSSTDLLSNGFSDYIVNSFQIQDTVLVDCIREVLQQEEELSNLYDAAYNRYVFDKEAQRINEIFKQLQPIEECKKNLLTDKIDFESIQVN